MMRRCFALATILLLAFTAALPAAGQSAAGQDSAWSLYLLNSTTNQLTRVYLDGTQQNVDLGVPAETYLGGNSIDFTADGNRAAICVVVNQADGAYATINVRDLTGGSASLAIDVGKTDGCWVNFSADASQIAVGVVRHYAGDPAADANVPAWQLLVFDAATGQQVGEMNPTKAASVGVDSMQTVMPNVLYFANGQIVFSTIAWGTEGFPTNPAYFWQLNGDSLQTIDRWWHNGLDSLTATGELAWVEYNQGVAAADPGGPVPQGNIVQLADKTGDARVIYADSDWVILDVKFIDNGRQLAINELQAFDPSGSNMGSQATRWVGLDRSGATQQLALSVSFSQLAAAPEGYVYFAANATGVSPLLTLEYRSGSTSTVLWQQQAQNGVAWSLIWAAPTPTADGLTPFPSVNP